jgi:hypothetical protein
MSTLCRNRIDMNGAPVVVEVPIPNDDFEAFLEGMIA